MTMSPWFFWWFSCSPPTFSLKSRSESLHLCRTVAEVVKRNITNPLVERRRNDGSLFCLKQTASRKESLPKFQLCLCCNARPCSFKVCSCFALDQVLCLESIDQAPVHTLILWWWCLGFFTVPNFGTAGIHSVHCSGIIRRFARQKKRDGFRTLTGNCTNRLWRFPNRHKDTHNVCFFWTLQSRKC